MAIFKQRLTAPDKTDKRFIRHTHGGYNTCIEINDDTGYVLPNCTGYAQGRLLEILGAKSANWKLPAGDAENWFSTAIKNGLQTGSVPKLGAVVCWRAGQIYNGKDGAGHVAIIEDILPNGDIVTSNSAHNGTEFFTQVVTKASGYMYSEERPLVGFIYCGIEFERPASSTTPSTTGNIVAGKEIVLNNTPCYTSETVKTSYTTKSGTFYLWDATVKNGRIRITNKPERVGVAGQVTCFVNVADIGLKAADTPVSTPVSTPATTPAPTTTAIKAGMQCVLKNTPVYSSESGACIGTRTGVYYTWDSTVKNGRIRMTNSPTRVGVAGQVSFFIETKYIK